MSHFLYRKICIYYASQTGNALRLAQDLLAQLVAKQYQASLQELDLFDPHQASQQDLHIVICSTTGNGEAADGGEKFLHTTPQNTVVDSFDFAVFGLGDVAYFEFCQFAQDVDQYLAQIGAKRVINLVKADLSYQQIFKSWLTALFTLLSGDKLTGLNLKISATAYSVDKQFTAPVTQLKLLGTAEYPVYEVSLDISNSGIYYQPGDFVYLVPQNQPQLLNDLAAYFGFNGQLAELAIQKLAKLELKKIPTTSLRRLAALFNNPDFTDLLRIKNKVQLDEYLYWHDILDVLQDFPSLEQLNFEKFCNCLPKILPRAYSPISTDSNQLKLLIKQVSFIAKQRQRLGKISANLLSVTSLPLYVRSNNNFHLNTKQNIPIIMLAIGTGIAPFIGFLQLVEQLKKTNLDYQKPMYLFFGEKYSQSHFFYQMQLQHWLERGVLQQLFTAFSRDQTNKIYIQQRMQQQAQLLWQLMEQGAHIYICGDQQKLAKPIETIFLQTIQLFSTVDEAKAREYWRQIKQNQRLHLDLY